MTPSGFGRLEEIFHAARRVEASRRAEFLAGACGDDAALRAEVEALLSAHETRGDLLASPFAPERFGLAGSTVPRPERIGRFKILDTLGAGGMGVVHLAEQDHPRRVVALKVIRPGMVTDEARRRFLREAQALGQLRHPSIAQVFDAGVEDGVPYIAMERVDGRPLLVFAEAEGLTRDERLELFCRICDAVQHAHDHGVIHRDLKPSNVLVEGARTTARPMVVDFGIARLTGGERSPATEFTGPGELLGTLPYMSPEQATGRPEQVDERTDVHALGVMLFELLTGALPRDLRGLPLPEAARRLAEEDPTTAAGIDPTLAGDLDTILSKAIAREKARRYPAPRELAADVRRHLRDEPIAARAPSAVDHVKKLARRHRALVIGTAMVLLTLAAGLTATAWQWRIAWIEKQKAERRFDQLRGLAGGFMFDLDPKLRHVPGALDARRAIVRTGLQYLDQLAAEAPADPRLRLELASAYQKMGDIQGSTTLPNLGDFSGALANYEKAESLLADLDAEGRDPVESRADLVTIKLRIGDARATLAGPAAALEAYDAAERLLSRSAGEAADPRLASLAADVAERRGNALLALGRPKEARELYAEALAKGHERVAADPNDLELRRNVGVSRTKLGNCATALGEHEEALAAFEAANREFRAILDATPENALARRDLAVTEERIGHLLTLLGRAAEAEPRYRAALEASEAAVGADPGDVQARLDLATHCCRLGELRLLANDLDEADRHFARYLEVTSRLAEERPQLFAAIRELGVAHYKQAELLRARALATSDGGERAPGDERVAAALERALAVFRDLEAKGVLRAEDASVPADLEAELRAARPRPENAR